MVGKRGLEPPRLAALVPQTSVSTIPPLARFGTETSYLFSAKNSSYLSLWQMVQKMVEAVLGPQQWFDVVQSHADFNARIKGTVGVKG